MIKLAEPGRVADGWRDLIDRRSEIRAGGWQKFVRLNHAELAWSAFPVTVAPMSQWYFNESGQQHGPVSMEEIKSMLEARGIQPSTLIWTEGMPDWKPVGTMEQFQISPYSPPAEDSGSEIDWSGYQPSGSQSRPWVRYWARTFDFMSFCVFLGAALMFVWPDLEHVNDTLLGCVLLLGYNFVEPIMLATVGTTPFKALLRVRVRNNDGTKPSYLEGLRRTFSVWIRGQGLGIPLIALFTGISSYSQLSNHGITHWDQTGGFAVTHQTVAWWRWLLLIGLFAGFICLMVLGSEA